MARMHIRAPNVILRYSVLQDIQKLKSFNLLMVVAPSSISLSDGGCTFMFSLTLTGSHFFAVSYLDIFFISMFHCCHSLSDALEVNPVMIFVQTINRAFDKWKSYLKSPLVLFDFSLTTRWSILEIIDNR